MTNKTNNQYIRLFTYFILILIRFSCTLQRGYIHPDEFFQGGQELFFGCNKNTTHDDNHQNRSNSSPNTLSSVKTTNGYEILNGNFKCLTTTWEYQPSNAIRSIIPPTVMTLVPLKIYVHIRNFFWNIWSTWSSSYIAAQNLDNNAMNEYDYQQQVWNEQLSGREILIIPRIFLTFLSILCLDFTLCFITTSYTTDQITTSTLISNQLLIFASSWPTLTFLHRPFTNTLETLILGLLLCLVIYDFKSLHEQSRNRYGFGNKIHFKSFLHLVLIGMLCSMGIFTRFTFVMFAFPIIIIYIYQRYYLYTGQTLKGEGDLTISTTYGIIWNFIAHTIYCGIPMCLGFIITSFYFLREDGRFYSYLNYHHHASSNLTSSSSSSNHINSLSSPNSYSIVYLIKHYFAPWNAFKYNSKVGNLSDHGLHPRITHALVNMPMLFGTLTILFYLKGVQMFFMVVRRVKSTTKSDSVKIFVHRLCRGMIITGLGILSFAPHQEPRFLLPIIVPITILHGSDLFTKKWRHLLLSFWIIFNICLSCFFGFFHQGGIVPSILYTSNKITSNMEHSNSAPKEILFFHTYMPPTFLFRPDRKYHHERISISRENNKKEETQICNSGDYRNLASLGTCPTSHDGGFCSSLSVVDLEGADIQILRERFYKTLDCESDKDLSSGSNLNNYIILISPSVLLGTQSPYNNQPSSSCPFLHDFTCHEFWRISQVSTEDMPNWSGSLNQYFSDMKLSVYNVKCRN